MMSTVRKSENLLPFHVISAAANGDTNAMCAILKHYEGYIVNCRVCRPAAAVRTAGKGV